MGYAIVTSECFGCKQLFSYNPHRVPSIRIDGDRQPVCQVCVDRTNPVRVQNGLPEIEVYSDAYSAIHESEL